VAPADYLARYQLADLFLDTFPFNGGTTANDALFMGLPLLTLSGRTFASRMAGSLLTHLDLPELITTNIKEYEERAVRFAKKPTELSKFKSRLVENKKTGTVFDIAQFVKDYENNIAQMLEEHRSNDIISAREPEITDTLSNHETVSLWEGSVVAGSDKRSLLVQGWTGINHSFAMVNQYQLLALSKEQSIDLFQQEMPYFSSQWNKEKNGAGFSDNEQKTFSDIKLYSGEPISAIYRISSPFNLENANSRVLTFMVTELGLTQKSFSSPPDLLTYQANGNYVVTPSQWSKDRIVDFGFHSKNVFVVPHGVDRNKFYPLNDTERNQLRTTFGYKDDDVIFLNVGAPLWNKGMDLILKAYFKVREKRKNVRLLIKDQKDLYGLSAQNMISNLVATGEIKIDNEAIESIKVISSTLSIEQLRSLYGMADYYISPYRAEGFNLPVIEAIACGTKAIVTAGGSTDDFCNEMTSVKIPSTKHEHAVVQTATVSAYLEPDLDALIEIWEKCSVSNLFDPLRLSFGRRDLIETFTWDRAAKLLTSLI
jgi:glycosyltransferase involved in cell wall biosynthesis